MEISEVAEETIVINVPDTSVPAAQIENTAMSNGGKLKKSILRKFSDVFYRKHAFLISCLLGVSTDPLFLYLPIIDQDIKCIRLDQRLQTFAIFFRSCTDLQSILDIMYYHFLAKFEIHQGFQPRSRCMYVLDILAVVPIPYMVLFLLTIKRSGFRILNFFLVLQYIPRVLRIYQLYKDGGRTPNHELTTTSAHPKIRVVGLFMLFLIILASHVFGAFWYYFSFDRNIDCWRHACQTKKYEFDTFKCRADTPINVTFLNDLCPISLPNATKFNFGIYLDALQSGTMSSTNFLQKFLYCFWWGLQNLSSFGQNLRTSTYGYESLFAVLICMTGMLLLLVCVNAILQTYMQKETTKSNLREEKLKRNQEIATWLCINGVSLEYKDVILKYVLDKLRSDQDVDIVNIHSILPWRVSLDIKKEICLIMLMKVPMFRTVGDKWLDTICGYLKPIMYNENSFIIQNGDPVDKMIFITQGVAWIYRTSADGSGSSSTNSLSKGDHYGEELINLAPDNDLFSLPISNRSVKCSTKVEAFTLVAEDLRKIKIKLAAAGYT